MRFEKKRKKKKREKKGRERKLFYAFYTCVCNTTYQVTIIIIRGIIYYLIKGVRSFGVSCSSFCL